jgi:hypothetical protein
VSEELDLFSLMIESGVVCMPFGEFHGRAEKLLGHPIWTHEFADENTGLDLKIALLAPGWKPERMEGPLESLARMMSR